MKQQLLDLPPVIYCRACLRVLRDDEGVYTWKGHGFKGICFYCHNSKEFADREHYLGDVFSIKVRFSPRWR